MGVKWLRLFMCLVVAVSVGAPMILMGSSETQAQDQQKQNLARQECLRTGGWWERITGVCEHGATAMTKKAKAYDTAKKACESKGGWFEPRLALCEFESAAKVSYQAAGYEQLQQACAQKGGWYDPAAGICDTGMGK